MTHIATQRLSALVPSPELPTLALADDPAMTLADDPAVTLADDPAAAPADEIDVRASAFERHRSMLRISLAIILLSFLLEVRPDQRVEFRFLPGLPMPEMCFSRLLWGTDCPGCGLTRGFIRIANGSFAEAHRLNRMSGLLALSVLGQIPYRLIALRELRRGKLARRTWPVWYGRAAIALLLGNWLLSQLNI